ncbi:TetR family transcriptional regulator [Nocardioides sp. TF02-7]|uniref:TetR/AcrR family transcriptional regulator n=1 Tax=Nocardioides sp. TF02-7 TaxID=2917724 RepID=UPI001F050707|nr:TetR family transcriptional regulator [Nocardioides sp. TF02-7]UMG94136.1 TetR family transcriptional regulator [Nocardioides sp. TF02-7]
MNEAATGSIDGRRARGDRRRAEIIEATLAVVQRDGAAGVTHRTVAKQAGITTSLTTYYFATLDDLLVAALSSVAEAYTTRVREIIDGSSDKLRGLAELIVDSAGPGRDRALAERELSTLAARRPALAPVARRWREDVAELAGTLTDDPTAIATPGRHLRRPVYGDPHRQRARRPRLRPPRPGPRTRRQRPAR